MSATPSLSELLGNPKNAAREMRSFRRSAKVFSSDRPRLIDEYPQQWVAVYGGAVRAHDAQLGEVLQQIRAQNLPPERTQIRFIDKTRRTMIL